MKTIKELPAFASEKEEAAWWDARSEETDTEMAAAIELGTAINVQDFLLKNSLFVETEPVTMQIVTDDLQMAKAAAAVAGISHEEYLAELVHEALKPRRAA